MMKSPVFAVLLLLAIGASACGIEGKFSNNDSNTVTLSGVVSETVAKPSFKPGTGAQPLHAAMGGGELKVLNAKGETVGTATIGADGSYAVSVAKGSNYILRAVKGNVCLKSFVEKVGSSQTITVDPKSSAVVKVLAAKLGNDKLGEPGQNVSTAITSADISAILVAIKNNGLLTAVAQAIAADIAANANYAASTVTVGAVSTAGDADASTIAISITSIVTITAQSGAPPTPTGVTAVAGDGQITVNWSTVTGATSYNLYYSTTVGTAGIKINGITTGTSYTLTGLTNGVTYYLTITASNGTAESSGSQIKAVTLSSISITPSPASVVVGYKTQQLTATVTYSDGSSKDISSSAAWSSSNSDVATVSAAGLATGVSTGAVTITATLNGVSGTLILNSSYVILKVPTPSNASPIVGLAWDGNNFWVATNPDSTRTIIKIDSNGSVLATIAQPVTGGVRNIAFDGTYLWVASQFDSKIYQITTSGSVLGSISATFLLYGLAYDGAYLWYSKEDSTTISGFIKQITTSGVETGKVINFPTDRPSCLGYDGTYVWTGTQLGGLQKFGVNGTKIASYNIDVANGNCALTFDGHNLWLAIGYSGVNEIQKLSLP